MIGDTLDFDWMVNCKLSETPAKLQTQLAACSTWQDLDVLLEMVAALRNEMDEVSCTDLTLHPATQTETC